MPPQTRFRPFPDDYLAHPDAAERRVLDFWSRTGVFAQQQSRRAGAEPFVFYEGPPTANGRPGVHHVFSRAIKDTVCRFQWAMGRRVERKAGWDTHGLPVELEVEKRLGISGKRQIEQDVGVARFNEACRESVFQYLAEWRSISERIGYWLDYDHPYVTYHAAYVESVWWLISRFAAHGLLEKRLKVVPYCPRCGTGLSSHEVGQGYRDVQDPSVTIRLPLADDASTSLLVWTTTPWTLPSNAGAAVHPDFEYVRARSAAHPGESFWLARERLPHVLPDGEILETKKGRELVGMRYVAPFPDIGAPDLRTVRPEGGSAALHRVFAGDFVTSEDGTGVVHMAPCYGADDHVLGTREGLPVLAAVGRDGRFAVSVGDVAAGTFFKEADSKLIAQLKQSGRLFTRTTVQHSYPFCWRCDTALLYFATPSWFLRTTAYGAAMVEENRRIRWVPPEIGSGRFGEWLAGNVDWALSRDRYWGTPLPVWECAACEAFQVVDSFATLRQRSLDPIPEEIDPHRPGIDAIRLRCDRCGGAATRSPAVVDCWFDSGAMPFAQHGWPFTAESRRAVADQFPAAFIAEGLDQTRGWFYTLHAIATFLTRVDRNRAFGGEPIPLPESGAYRACIVNGLVLDASGRKMSKRLGNAVDPFEAVAKHGADAVRLLLLGSGALHTDRRFDADALTSLRRQTILPLVNCVQFFATYANEVEFGGTALVHATNAPLLDRWIRSRAASLARSVGDRLTSFDLPGALLAIGAFGESELSNWYVRRSRRRFQSGSLSDRAAGLATLQHVLRVVARCLAPFAPFAAELIWHRTHGDSEGCASVHLQDFPLRDAEHGADLDLGLEAAMGHALVVARLARAIREKNRIRNTVPLERIDVFVPSLDDGARRFLAAVEEAVREEVNVDDVRVRTFTDALAGDSVDLRLRAKPNFPVLGKRAGKAMRALQRAIEGLDAARIVVLMEGGNVTVEVEGTPFDLGPGDVVVSAEVPGDRACDSDGGITVSLSVCISDEAIDRALARELASAVNQARRDRGFQLSDRCRVVVRADEPGNRVHRGVGAGEPRASWLQDVRANSLELRDGPGTDSWIEAPLLEGHVVGFLVDRV